MKYYYDIKENSIEYLFIYLFIYLLVYVAR